MTRIHHLDGHVTTLCLRAIDYRVTRRIEGDNRPEVEVSIEITEGMDVDAELRALDHIAHDLASRCPGCWVGLGEKHADGCPLAPPVERVPAPLS